VGAGLQSVVPDRRRRSKVKFGKSVNEGERREVCSVPIASYDRLKVSPL
jgi:hypothetical protein